MQYHTRLMHSKFQMSLITLGGICFGKMLIFCLKLSTDRPWKCLKTEEFELRYSKLYSWKLIAVIVLDIPVSIKKKAFSGSNLQEQHAGCKQFADAIAFYFFIEKQFLIFKPMHYSHVYSHSYSCLHSDLKTNLTNLAAVLSIINKMVQPSPS